MNVPKSVSTYLDKLAEQAILDDSPPPDSFTAQQFHAKVITKSPAMTFAQSQGKLDRMVSAGIVQKSDKLYVVNGKRCYFYTMKAGDK